METLYLLLFIWLIAAALVLLANRINASTGLRSSADASDSQLLRARSREQDSRTENLEQKYVDWYLKQGTL